MSNEFAGVEVAGLEQAYAAAHSAATGPFKGTRSAAIRAATNDEK